MPDQNPTTRLENPISGDRAEQLASDLGHYKSRMVIQDVVKEYVGSSAFATRVKGIQLESLESTETYKKLSDKVQNQINTTLNDRNLKNRNLIVTNVISGITAVGAVAAVIVATVK